mmetsp:Transcript_64475/g.168793  ORF Transcript_64475/g.168793 Transcript_64475/m.168793 type:complete len:271 (+) Transcript_64475:496-1308(+)
MGRDLVHDALLPKLLVQRRDVTPGSEDLEDHRVPARHLLPVLLPGRQQAPPGAPKLALAPGVAAGEGGRAHHLQRREAQPRHVEARLVLLAEVLVLGRLLRPVEAHEEGAGRPVAAVPGDVRGGPLLGPGPGVHREAEVDEPEGRPLAHLLLVQVHSQAAAIHGVAQEDVVRVHVAVKRVGPDPLQGGAQLPDQLQGQQAAAAHGAGAVLPRRRRAAQEGVQRLPGHPSHGQAHAGALPAPLHRVGQVPRDAHRWRRLLRGWGREASEAL